MARGLPLGRKLSGATADKFAEYRRIILGLQKLRVNAMNCLPLDKRRERKADGTWETNRDDKAGLGDRKRFAQFPPKACGAASPDPARERPHPEASVFADDLVKLFDAFEEGAARPLATLRKMEL